ncbi:delta-type opioid receptor [Syngnathus scovelli]|uniref:delta-type opioid receptor n=1 Tax=Syngnathus scovelli TaxID=161590 RepID=UPI00210F4303|nr:delta-type opioid receptor [Syngnathus scovelli]
MLTRAREQCAARGYAPSAPLSKVCCKQQVEACAPFAMMESAGPAETFRERLQEDASSAAASGNASAWSRNGSVGDQDWELDQDALSPVIPIITAVYSLVFVVGLLGNCLVMYVIVRYTKMKTATNIYIFNLALADALVTTTMPFQSTDYLLNTWPFGQVLCKVFIAIDYYNMFTSIFTLTMMSVDRYVAVCHPVKALDFRTPVKAKVINVCIWILSSAAGIPAFILGGTQTNLGITECTLQFPEPYVYWDTVMKMCVFVFAFVVPVLIITVCYSLMLLRLKSVRMLSGSRVKDRNLRRITRLVVVVVAVFVVCWTPIHIFILVKALASVPETTAIMAAYFFCVALGYTNSSLNPILYAFLDENFKRCFKDFCVSARLRQQKASRSRKAAAAPEAVGEAAVPLRNPDENSKAT